MVGKKQVINTSVDKLVHIVNEKGRLSFKDAAKKLAIPVSSVEEWAHFLEEEDVLEIDYKFMTPFLVKKELTPEQKKSKLQRVTKEKQIFDKKVEAAVSYFDELDKKLNRVSGMFKALDGKLGNQIGSVNDEIDQLQKAERQKEDLDKKIIAAKKRALEKIKEIEKHIDDERISYRKAFAQAKGELDHDQELLEKSKSFLEKVKSEESFLQKRIKEVQSMSRKIQDEVDMRKKMLAKTETHIDDVQKKHETLKKDLLAEQDTLKRMIDENQHQEKVIADLQKTIFEKMEEGEKRLTQKEKEIKDLPKKFKDLLSHKKELQDIFSTVSHEEMELKHEIEKLQKEAKIVQLSIGKPEFEKEMKRLNAQISTITDKRQFFKDKITKMIKLMHV